MIFYSTRKGTNTFVLTIIGLLFLLLTSCQKESDIVNSNLGPTIVKRDLCQQDICIGSWNAQLFDAVTIGDGFPEAYLGFLDLGPECEGSNCDKRALAICAYVDVHFDGAPDVMTFQEVFETDACNTLIDCMTSRGYGFNSGCSESTGLITFSKFEMTSETITFEDVIGHNVASGWDQFKDKGFTLSEIQLDECDCKVQIINTHLNAGPSSNDQNIRILQMEAIDEIASENSDPCQTLFFTGDFNFDTSIIPNGFDVIRANTLFGPAGVTPSPTSSSGTVLDYVLVSTDDSTNISNVTYQTHCGCRTFPDQCWWDVSISYYIENNLEIPEPHEIPSWDDYNEIPTEFLDCGDCITKHCVSVPTAFLSDHRAVEACMTVSCDEDCSTVPPVGDCDPPCEQGYFCFRGKCVEDINSNSCYPPCPENEQCIEGNCVPL